jgi:hypothetical protein
MVFVNPRREKPHVVGNEQVIFSGRLFHFFLQW